MHNVCYYLFIERSLFKILFWRTRLAVSSCFRNTVIGLLLVSSCSFLVRCNGLFLIGLKGSGFWPINEYSMWFRATSLQFALIRLGFGKVEESREYSRVHTRNFELNLCCSFRTRRCFIYFSNVPLVRDEEVPAVACCFDKATNTELDWTRTSICRQSLWTERGW